MRRTVKFACAPLRRSRITVPWKTCTRSRLPSTISAWTRTVSPGRNWGRSIFFLVRVSNTFMAVKSFDDAYSHKGGRLLRTAARDYTTPIMFRQGHLGLVCTKMLSVVTVLAKPRPRGWPPPGARGGGHLTCFSCTRTGRKRGGYRHLWYNPRRTPQTSQGVLIVQPHKLAVGAIFPGYRHRPRHGEHPGLRPWQGHHHQRAVLGGDRQAQQEAFGDRRGSQGDGRPHSGQHHRHPPIARRRDQRLP